MSSVPSFAVLVLSSVLAAAETAAPPAPLSAEDAARLALARNAAFKAQLEEVGLAEADLSQAGILENPRVHGALRYVGTQNGARGHELGVKVNLLSLFELPLKRRVAASRLEQARFRLSHEVLGLETQVKAAFYSYQAALRRLALGRDAAGSLDAAADLSERQREAGNVSALELAETRAAREEGVVALAGAEAAAAAARERLGLLMGLQDGSAWSVAPELAEPPPSDPDAAAVEAAALAQRWDLQAARKEPAVLEQARRLERLGLFSPLEVGVDTEREYGGATGYGPEFEVGVPLFDRRQAARARLRAQARRSLASADALEAQVRFEVRAGAAALAAARKAAESHRDAMVPLRREIVAETLKNYNYMLVGAGRLLEAKRAELGAAAAYAEALRDYWTARAELERAAGGKLPDTGGK